MTPWQFSKEDWPTVSALLDHALTLAPAERETWLEQLPPDRLRFKDVIRGLIATADASGGALETLPRLDLSSHQASDLQPGGLVGPYRLIAPLGAGGMGAVWLAERADGELNRRVALKMPHVAWTGALRHRMARERDILAALEHPNIARLYDAGTDATGRPYLALEYVEGEPIDLYAARCALSIDQRLRLLIQVASAVSFAHGRLIVHRDLKPSNILITSSGEVRLLDFGIAKLLQGTTTEETELTRDTGRALTLDYASPEQILGQAIGTASDVYSLGVIAYELLSGARPYQLKRGAPHQIEQAIVAADVPPASSRAPDPACKGQLRGDLDAILNKALKKDPQERYPTVDALADDWRRYLAREPVTARPDSLTYRVSKLVRRYPIPVASAGVVVVAIVLGASVALYQRDRALDEAAAARREAARAEAVRDLLVDIFKANSVMQPNAEAAQNMTARELLAAGIEKVDTLAERAPDAHAYLLRLFGDLHDELSLLDQAHQLHERSSAAALRTFGEGSVEKALADLRLAQVLMRKGEVDRAQALVVAAKSVLEAQVPSSPDLGHAWATEARVFLHSDTPRAERAGQRATQILDAVEPRGDRAATAYFLHGLALQTLGRPADAAQAYRGSRERFTALYSATSNPASAVLGAEARMLMAMSRWKEAGTAIDESLKVLRARGDVIDRCSTLIAKARLELANGRGEQAEAALTEALELRETVPDEVAFPTAAALRAHLGTIAFRRGDLQRGIGLLQDGLRTLPAEDEISRMRFLATLSMAYLEAGDLKNARASYAEARELRGKRKSVAAVIRELLAEAGARLAAHAGDEAALGELLNDAREAGGKYAGRQHALLQAQAWGMLKRPDLVQAAVEPHVEPLLALPIGEFDALFDAELAMVAAHAIAINDVKAAQALLARAEPAFIGTRVAASSSRRKLEQLKATLK
jgi:serine/threonine-protein kinase